MIFDLIYAFTQLGDERLRKILLMSIMTVLVSVVALFYMSGAIYRTDFVKDYKWATPFGWVWMVAYNDSIVTGTGTDDWQASYDPEEVKAIQNHLTSAAEAEEYEINIDDPNFYGLVDLFVDNAVDIARWKTFLALSPLIIIMVTGLFARQVGDAVDRIYYHQLPEAPEDCIKGKLVSRFLGLFFIVNVLALPIYVLPNGIGFVAYLAINGYIVGRSSFNLIARRRMDADKVKELRRRNYLRVLLAGVIITLGFATPIINFVMPLVAVAFMQHIFERLRGTERQLRLS